MKTEIEPMFVAHAALTQPLLVTAPSLRVPVTATNRSFLRRLRAAELSAWEEADHNPHRPTMPPWLRREPCTF